MKAYILAINKDAHLEEQWDFGLVKDFLDGKLWQTPDWEGFEIELVNKLPKDERAIVLIAARHHASYEQEVNAQLNKINRVVLFLMGDEEAEFDVKQITHDNIAIWVQNPHISIHDDYNKIGTGYPMHMSEHVPKTVDKSIDLFFAGQVTHSRREELIEALDDCKVENAVIIQTPGFTQGETPENYYKYYSQSKIAPAPSGAVIPDSFRLFEALECMAIPIADQKTPKDEIWDYWDWMFAEICPFPTVTNWFAINDIVDEIELNYPQNIHKQTQWWIHWKRKFAYKVMEQLHA